nr:unnamed protein product [Digitaria exilis]
MAAMFPKGIRALMVDDDNSTVAHALKSLSTLKLKGIDVVLVHAAKAATCGFNFRAIIEADLGIPVIYFLPLDHRATGDEAAELLKTLEEGTYIMTKPLDIDEVCSRLWRVIAWRKCDLQRRPGSGAGDGFMEGEDDEGRVHYKVVRRGRRGQKRNGGGRNAAAGAGAGTGGGGRQQPEPAGKGKEKVNEGDYYQQQQ